MFSLQSSQPVDAGWSIEARRSLTAYAAQFGATGRQQADVAIATNHVLMGLGRSATRARHVDGSRTIRVTAEQAGGLLDVVVTDSHVERDDHLRDGLLEETTAAYEVTESLEGGVAVAMHFAVGNAVPA